MPKRRKPKPFRATTAVKAVARAVVGTPPPTRTAPDGKKRNSKSGRHKPTLEQLLRSED